VLLTVIVVALVPLAPATDVGSDHTSATLRGRVLDAQTGEPISKATVSVPALKRGRLRPAGRPHEQGLALPGLEAHRVRRGAQRARPEQRPLLLRPHRVQDRARIPAPRHAVSPAAVGGGSPIDF